ncbi:MAG TPA: site-specific DNA-methyltransferase [Propionibacteriaceae bacterium]
MSDHVILLAPSSNRVYAGSADTLAAAELAVLLGEPAMEVVTIEPVTIAGVGYLRVAGDLDDALRSAVGRLSTLFALFGRTDGQLLPIEVAKPDLFDEDLVTIPKYPGKTNEQFTRLLLNVTLASLPRPSTGPLSVLDPLCGRGTTLSTGLMLGHEVAGVEGDLKAVEAYAAYLKTYLRRKRIKHTAEMTPVRREGKSLGRRLDVEVTPPGTDRRLRLTVFSGDTRQSPELYGKRRFDAIVADAPYGVVHGSHTDVRGVSGKRDRSPAGLIGEAIQGWAGQLKRGGALGLSWNTFGLTRERLTTLAEDAGLVARSSGPYTRFAHRVDSAISRDVFVAVKE